MKVSLVHMSDIHYKDDHTDYLDSKIDSLVGAIVNELETSSHGFLVITGDVAYSGREDELLKGGKLIDTVVETVEMKTQIRLKVVMIPGNHDCDFSPNSDDPDDVRSSLIQKNKEELKQGKFIRSVIKPLKNYFDFELLYMEEGIEFNSPLYKKISFEIEEKKIVFNCFNTAWTSEIHEKPSQMVYPLELFESQIEASGDFNISIHHHPIHWFEEDVRRKFEKTLSNNSDLILSGHEHTKTSVKRTDAARKETLAFEAKALQTNSKEESAFSIIELDFKETCIKRIEFTWVEGIYQKDIEEFTMSFDREKSKMLSLKTEFQKEINDTGMPIKHPKLSGEITLADIYVYPEIQRISHRDSSEVGIAKIKSSKEFFEKNEYNKIFLVGDEGHGKTAFCRMFFNTQLKRDRFPIFIRGDEIRRPRKEDLKKIVGNKFKEQYDSDTIERFEQLDKSLICIIIDDIDSLPNNEKFQTDFFQNLIDLYPNILITGGEIFKIQKLILTQSPLQESLNQFEYIELKHFGHTLRAELIEKWHRIGDPYAQEDEDLIRNIDRHQKIVQTIIGNNFVPSLPIFILTILQSTESNEKNLSESAYGYYYEHLINQAFIDINLLNEDIDSFKNYLSHLAYSFFMNTEREITYRELEEFHNSHKAEYDLTIELKDYKDKLIKSKILSDFNGHYRFKYKYIYYYFVAKFLATNIDEEFIQERVSEMCRKLYVEEYANIIMFLTHLSKSKIILKTVHESALEILEDFEPSKLEKDIINVNSLIDKLPSLIVDFETDRLEKRKQYYRERDRAEQAHEETAMTTDETTMEFHPTETFDIVSRVNWAIKTIEIMGQILKNYYGSTKADDKFLLGQEAYHLSMRALSTFLNVLQDNQEMVVGEVIRIIEENGLESEQKKEAAARNLVFNITAAISHFFIMKVSDSLGTVNLKETYQKVIEKNNYTSYQLIDLAIKLEHEKEIPFKDIERVLEQLETHSNLLASRILKQMAINRLHMFESQYKDRQRLIDVLNLNKKDTNQKLLMHKLKK